jgi:DNA modification methylase
VKVGPFDVSGSYVGDCRDLLRQMPDGCVQTCVTSPPYWGLRSYLPDGHEQKCNELGLEQTPDAYVTNMVDVFREVRRALADDGTLWLNLGDSYAGSRSGPQGESGEMADRAVTQHRGMQCMTKGKGGDPKHPSKGEGFNDAPNRARQVGLKPKDLVGIPWMVAFALRADGWYLRSDIIWHKRNPLPESITDRPTKAHEYIFLLAKSQTYFYDHEAIKEPAGDWGERDRATARTHQEAAFRNGDPPHRGLTGRKSSVGKNEEIADPRRDGFNDRWNRAVDDGKAPANRNKRSVWTISNKPYGEAHSAVFPPDLIEPCILAGSRPGDLVLDPFFGSGTTGKVAEDNGRLWLGFDLNPAYHELQKKRTAQRGLCFAPVTKEG